MAPTSALLLDHKWCMRILRGGKTWEIRSMRCHKKAHTCIGIACTAKSSPTGQALLLGEVVFVGCFKVAEAHRGFVAPPTGCPENYMFLPEHMRKHQISSVSEFPVVATYKHVYAWEVQSPVEYAEPKALPSKPGRVVWAKLK